MYGDFSTSLYIKTPCFDHTCNGYTCYIHYRKLDEYHVEDADLVELQGQKYVQYYFLSVLR